METQRRNAYSLRPEETKHGIPSFLNLENDGLRLEISDDGLGLPSNMQPGVGLNSMRERAEELGVPMLILTKPGRLPDLAALLDRCPDLNVTIDHIRADKACTSGNQYLHPQSFLLR